jgi:hypothetical protein
MVEDVEDFGAQLNQIARGQVDIPAQAQIEVR